MQIQDLKSFLMACQNVCIIKKKVKKEESANIQQNKEEQQNEQQNSQNQEATSGNKNDKLLTRSERMKRRQAVKEQQTNDQIKAEEKFEQQLFISLSFSAFKDLLNQFIITLQSQQGVPFTILVDQERNQNQKPQLQKFQQDIVYTILDQFIDQIRDMQMLILQSCKQKQNPSQFGLKLSLNDKNQLIVSDPQRKIEHQRYLFDSVALLSNLTYILTHSPILVQSLLKHKEGKTYKFIIRNMYYLISLTLEKIENNPGEMKDSENEYKVWFDEIKVNKKKLDIINEFFKRVLLENPHLSLMEKKLKYESRIIFVKENLKNLCDNDSSKYPQWENLRLIFNIGAVFLLAEILRDEEKDENNQDKKLEVVIHHMQKYRNNNRLAMIMHLIHECQQITKTEQGIFALLKQFERIQSDIQNNLQFFNLSKSQIQLCVQALSNILKPFDSSKNLWGDQGDSKNMIEGQNLNEKDLGFLADGSRNVIDEEMNEDDDEDEEDDEDVGDSSSESQENEDDDLLGSERSERNFRFSDADEPLDDEYGDEDDDNSSGGEGMISVNRDRHRGQNLNDEEDEENEEDDDDIDVPNQEDLALIEEMLNRGGQGSDSLDEDLYGNEDGEDGEEDDYYLE